MKLSLAGVGPGREACITGQVREALGSAGLVLATPRLYSSFRHLNPRTEAIRLADLPERIRAAETAGERYVLVLVSGDGGFFSAAARLRREFAHLDITCLAGLNSLQYLCAALRRGYEGIKTISVHGRGPENSLTLAALPPRERLAAQVLPHVAYNSDVFLLTGGEQSARAVIEVVTEAGLGEALVSVGENLSLPDERITTEKARALCGRDFAPLSCLLIRNEARADPYERLPDSAFTRRMGERGASGASVLVPMTKQAVRALVLDALALRPDDFVADIGAGTGSVSIAMARQARRGMIWAVERDAAACALCRENIERLGARNIRLLQAEAPDMPELPPVDKAFIGGSGGAMEAVVATLLARNPVTRLVATAVTLESLHQASRAFSNAGCAYEVICCNIARAEERGAYHMMRAENPVYIISGARHAR